MGKNQYTNFKYTNLKYTSIIKGIEYQCGIDSSDHIK